MQDTLNFDGQDDLTTLNPNLRCYEFSAKGSGLRELPPITALDQIDLSDCARLERLPENLTTGWLSVRNCRALRALPEGIDVSFLDVSGCVNLTEWPLFGRMQIGRFAARGCHQLTQLPVWINHIAQLDLRGCVNLTELPEGLHVTGWIDIGDTQISSLPAGCISAELRWNGVAIDQRIAFKPHTIHGRQVLAERNTERRRVMLERMGVDRFIDDVRPQTLYTDTDPGGERKLLRVDLDEDEPLVVLSVSCPSTARRYLLRVPPNMQTCHQAAAWIAGFDDPAQYAPLIET